MLLDPSHSWGSGGGTAVADPDDAPPFDAADDVVGAGNADRLAVGAFVGRILGAVEESAGDGSYAAARRRILRELEGSATLTAAKLQRAYPVAADYLGTLLADLVEDELIERTDAGTESFRLTDAGTAALHGTRDVQTQLIARLMCDVAAGDIGAAVEVYRTLQAALGHGAR